MSFGGTTRRTSPTSVFRTILCLLVLFYRVNLVLFLPPSALTPSFLLQFHIIPSLLISESSWFYKSVPAGPSAMSFHYFRSHWN